MLWSLSVNMLTDPQHLRKASDTTTMIIFRLKDLEDGLPISLYDCILLTDMQNVANPHDKIFGLLGVPNPAA